jgi:hypothetical protein
MEGDEGVERKKKRGKERGRKRGKKYISMIYKKKK